MWGENIGRGGVLTTEGEFINERRSGVGKLVWGTHT